MSMSFPDDVRNPDRKGPNPFAEDHWDRPGDDIIRASAADERPPVGDETNSPYVSSDAAGDYRPTGYVPTMMARSHRVFRLAVVGATLTVFQALSCIFVVVSQTSFLFGLLPMLFYLLNFAGIAFCCTAFALGRSDQRAIALGAIAASEPSKLQLGTTLGLIGMVLGVIGAIGPFLI